MDSELGDSQTFVELSPIQVLKAKCYKRSSSQVRASEHYRRRPKQGLLIYQLVISLVTPFDWFGLGGKLPVSTITPTSYKNLWAKPIMRQQGVRLDWLEK